ncbi:hypothetical protein K440DRAFT_610891, partial [Wilcoxina mikolae CBS 423.85]
MNYIDEIEALKEEVGKVKEGGVREKEEAVAKWKRLVMKAQVKHKAEIEKEKKVVSGLKNEIEDLKLTVKGLTSMLGEPELKRGHNLEKAFERYQDEVKRSGERFKMVLVQAVTDAQLRADKRLPDSYRRPETPTDAADQHIHSNNTAALAELQGAISPPVTKANEGFPLRQRLQNNSQPAFRDLVKDKAHRIHIDIKDHPEHSTRPLSI